MHQSDFMKGKHDISKIKNMKKLQVSQLTQQQYEAIQRNVILMHTHIYSEYTMHNAHSSPSKYPSRCQSLGHQSLSPLQSRKNWGRHNWHEQKQSKSFWHGKATCHKVRDWISSPNDAAVSILDQKWLMALVMLFKNFTQGQGQPAIYKLLAKR